MLEEAEIVNTLLTENKQFKRLYDKHFELDKQVDTANRNRNAMDDLSLERLKKEKLILKDQMAEFIEQYKQNSGG